jgi:hypothetical protein
MILCARCGLTADAVEDLPSCAPEDLVRIDSKDITRDHKGRVIDCHAADYEKKR